MNRPRVVADVAAGLSYTEAGLKHGLTRNQVARACFDAGLKIGSQRLPDGKARGHKLRRAAIVALRADPIRDAKRLAALRRALRLPAVRARISEAAKLRWARRNAEGPSRG